MNVVFQKRYVKGGWFLKVVIAEAKLEPMNSPVNTVGQHNETWQPPTNGCKNPEPPLVAVQCIEEEHRQICSLTHHPEVGGDSEVGGGDVEKPAPGLV